MRSTPKLSLVQFLCLAAVCSVAVACSGSMTPAQQAQYDRVKCEIAALEPVAASDADAIVHAVEDGRLGVEDVFDLTHAAEASVKTARADFAACRAQFPRLHDGPATVTQ